MRAAKASTLFILVTIFLEATSMGLGIPVMPRLLKELLGSDYSGASTIFGLLLATEAAAILLFAPVMGLVSDSVGRRPVILLGLCGGVLIKLTLAKANAIWLLFIVQFVSGATGGILVPARAYLADTLPPEKRAQGFAHMAAALGSGMLLGPIIGGALGAVDARLPYWVAGVVTAIDLIYGVLVLPESRRTAAVVQESLREVYRKAFTSYHWLLSRPAPFLRTLTALVLSDFGNGLSQSVWIFYLALKLHWSSTQIGRVVAVIAVMMILTQALLARVSLRKLGEYRTVVAGLTLQTLGYLVVGLADQTWQVYLGVAVGTVGSVANPCFQARLSRGVSATEQGRLQGAMLSLLAPLAIVRPIIATALFHAFTLPGSPLYIPGVTYYVSAALAAIALLLMTRESIVGEALQVQESLPRSSAR